MRLALSPAGPVLDLAPEHVQLTEAQRAALAFDREVVVTAGAGAGKTHTLSLRYVALLLHIAVASLRGQPTRPRPDIEAVLVLTFTEKAAEEMAERCYRRLLDLAAAVDLQRDDLDRSYGSGFSRSLTAALDHLLDSFDRARIGTFHSFCARLLQEFPAETGAAPGFEVLDDEQASEATTQAVHSAVATFLASGDPDVGPVLEAFGTHRQLCRGLEAILAERAALGPRLRAHAAGEVTIDELIASSPVPPDVARRWIDTQGGPVIVELCRIVGARGGAYFRQRLKPLRERIEADDRSHLHTLGLMAEILDATQVRGRLRSFSYPSVAGPRRLWGSEWQHAQRRLDALRERCRGWPELREQVRGLPGPADARMLDTLGGLCRLALRAEGELHRRFDQAHALDFEELQIRAVAAVGARPELRTRLAERHRYLMVDEFQDTDLAQWDLVRAIGRPEDRPADRIFLVGDAKQSIYRFRGGDVTVFRAATDDLGVAPVVLAENFRSRDVLIEWFNAFFGHLLGPPDLLRPAWEAAYEPLRPARADRAGGSVTLVPHGAPGGAEGAMVEAEALARLIATEILPGVGPYRGARLTDRALHPTPPIAVLLRARTWLPVYEEALERFAVPHIVAKGVGFWSRPEVVDLVNALHALATGDRISLVGVLRSPLFGVADQDIHDLADGTDGLTTFFQADPEPGAGALGRARAVLTELWSLRHRVPVADLLGRLSVATAAPHLYEADDPSGQAAANVERLIELATRYDGSGVAGLDATAEAFLARVAADAREPEAAVTPSAARVVVMTVHAAKGLEFPVVIVPALGTRPPAPRANPAIGRVAGRWELACRVLDPTASVRKLVGPGLHDRIQAVDEREDLAESKRLLYVAATRARDHLVLLGGRGPEESTTWMDMVRSFHGVPPVPRAGLSVRPVEDVLALVPPPPAPPAAVQAPPGDALHRVAPVAAPFELEVSPSSLDLFVEAPERWYRRHILHIPELPTEAGEAGQRALALAGARGDVIHGLLEDDVADDEDTAWARWQARAFAVGATIDEVERLFPALLAHLRTTADDRRIRHRLAATGWPELSFRLPFPGSDALVLLGQIDHLWLDRDAGCWVVLDYKSERVHDDPIRAAQRHQRQLLAYAWAATQILTAHGQPPVGRGEVYFTAIGELVPLGPWTAADLDGFADTLRDVGRVAQQSWSTVRDANPSPGSPPPAPAAPVDLGSMDDEADALPPEPGPAWNRPFASPAPAEDLPPEPASPSRPADDLTLVAPEPSKGPQRRVRRRKRTERPPDPNQLPLFGD